MIKGILFEGWNLLMYSSVSLMALYVSPDLKKPPYNKTTTNNKIKQKLIHSSLPF